MGRNAQSKFRSSNNFISKVSAVSPAKYIFLSPMKNTNPQGAPPYAPSGVEFVCKAYTIFTFPKGRLKVPPKLNSVSLSSDIPCFLTHPAVSTIDRKSTRLNSSHMKISYSDFFLQK